MKVINKVGIITIIWTSFWGMFLSIMENIIGGNATNGYHTELEYFVGASDLKTFYKVSKYIWYIDYVASCVFIVFLFLSVIYMLFVFTKYIGPKWKKLGERF